MHEQLQILVNKFKNHHYYSQTNHPISRNKKTANYQPNNQELILITQRVSWLQQVVESLITDGNRMSQYYQQILEQNNSQLESLKQEFQGKQQCYKQETQQHKRHIEELCTKLQIMKQEISNKQETLRDITEKYDQLEEKASQVHITSTTEVKKIENQLFIESKILEDELNRSRKIINDKQNYQAYLQEKYDALIRDMAALKEQNQYYVQKNNHLLQQIQNLKNNPQPLPNSNHIYVYDLEDKNFFQQNRQKFKKSFQDFDKSSAKSSQNMAFDSIIQVNGRQVNFNEQKQLLNISEHYCKSMIRNRSLEKSKFFLNDLQDISRSNILKFQPQPVIEEKKKPSQILQIPDKQQQTHHNTMTLAKIHLEESSQQVQDPYKTFFMLLTQSEKLNSPVFDKISSVNLTHLYEELRAKRVPYNKWQEQIKSELDKKSKKYSKTTTKTVKNQKQKLKQQ